MKTRLLVLILLAVVIGGSRAGLARQARTAPPSGAGGQTQRFITVEGADLKSKLDAAVRQARSRSPQTRFWVAYSFDVRPGVAVDLGEVNFNGSMQSFGGVTVFSGTSNGVTVETRNLGVFLLYEPGDKSIGRVEIYNLDRQREYSGYPVYWLGRGGNEESLNYLKSVADSAAAKRATENATVAIGLHDDPRVGAMMKDTIRRSSNKDVREAAIYWLGIIGGESAFLGDIVRNEQENTDVREAAAAAIGRSREPAALATLQGLYEAVSNRDVKEQILSSISKNDNQRAAADFLLKVAKGDPDRDLRETAVHRLGRIPGTSPALVDIIRNEQEQTDVREAAVLAMGKSQDAAAASTLQDLYASVSNRSIKEQIINSVSKGADRDAAVAFLIRVAEGDPDREIRQEAIMRLGKTSSARGVEALGRIANSADADADSQEEAVMAIGKSGHSEAVPMLIQIAKSHPRQEVREAAVRRLSKSGDERAKEFLRQVLSK